MISINNWVRLIIFSLIIYTFSIVIIGINEFHNTLKIIPINNWIIALFFLSLSHLLLSIRWFYFINYLKCKITYIDSLKIYIAGLSLMAAPARSGESLRSIWLLNRHSFPLNIGLSITFAERIGELFSALLLISLCIKNQQFIFIPIILVSLLLFIPLISKETIAIYWKSIVHFIPFLQRLNSFPSLIQEASATINKIKLLFKVKSFFLSLVLSSLSWVLESILLFKIFSVLNVHLTLEQSIVIRTLMGIGGVISLLPGGLITSESTSIALAIAYGSGKPEAFTATLFIRLYTLFLPSLIGLIAVIVQKDLNLPPIKSSDFQ